jgi:hypothetical protein
LISSRRGPDAERIATAAKDVKTAQYRSPADEFYVSQNLNDLNPIGQRHQGSIGAAKIEFERAPHVCCPF